MKKSIIKYSIKYYRKAIKKTTQELEENLKNIKDKIKAY